IAAPRSPIRFWSSSLDTRVAPMAGSFTRSSLGVPLGPQDTALEDRANPVPEIEPRAASREARDLVGEAGGAGDRPARAGGGEPLRGGGGRGSGGGGGGAAGGRGGAAPATVRRSGRGRCGRESRRASRRAPRRR